jgi:hypothetical protein
MKGTLARVGYNLICDVILAKLGKLDLSQYRVFSGAGGFSGFTT